MPLTPTNQFLFETIFLNAEGLAELSNKLLAAACEEGADRRDLLSKMQLVDALGNFKFPGEYPPTRRRLAA